MKNTIFEANCRKKVNLAEAKTVREEMYEALADVRKAMELNRLGDTKRWIYDTK